MLEAFIAQHYLDERMPPLLIAEPRRRQAALIEALAQQCGVTRQRCSTSRAASAATGSRCASKGAEIALARLLAEEGSQQARTRALVDALGLEVERHRHASASSVSTSATPPAKSTQASCVVFEDHKMQSAQYRRYNIDGITPGDDYAAMRQVLTRRYAKMVEAASRATARCRTWCWSTAARARSRWRARCSRSSASTSAHRRRREGRGPQGRARELVFADGRAEGRARQAIRRR